LLRPRSRRSFGSYPKKSTSHKKRLANGVVTAKSTLANWRGGNISYEALSTSHYTLSTVHWPIASSGSPPHVVAFRIGHANGRLGLYHYTSLIPVFSLRPNAYDLFQVPFSACIGLCEFPSVKWPSAHHISPFHANFAPSLLLLEMAQDCCGRTIPATTPALIAPGNRQNRHRKTPFQDG